MKSGLTMWVWMVLAMLLHLGGYLAALMTHPFEIPSSLFPEPEVPPPSIEDILENKTRDIDWYLKTTELDRFVEELNERRKAIEIKELSLRNLEARIATEKEELKSLKEEIERRHELLSQQIITVRANEAANLRVLAQSYSEMDPASTVRIFTHMENALVVKILSLMKPEIVAAVFGEMSKPGDRPENQAMIRRAAVLTEQLRLHNKERQSQ